MTDYQALNTFNAKGNYHAGAVSIPVELTGSYKSHSDDPVEIHVWSEEVNASVIFNDFSLRCLV
jgi:hypothetical protein